MDPAARLITPDFARFCELAAGHNRVPLSATLIGDELTPVSAFARLQAGAARAFLLESVEGGEKIARYSFLGADPSLTFSATRERVRLEDHRAGTVVESSSFDPLADLQRHLRQYRAAVVPGLPRFVGGAVGYAAYDAVRYVERLPHAPADDRGLPDLLFDIYESMVIFDHVRKTVLVVAYATTEEPRARAGEAPAEPQEETAALRTAYDAAVQRIENIIACISRPLSLPPVRIELPAAQQELRAPLERYRSNLDQPAFECMVEKCKEYIRAGDVFQVVVSQRLTTQTRADPFDIYRALRVINPSPFMFYLKSPQVTLVGASPEVMCRVEDGMVTNRPLAGTRPRGATEAEDRRLREELLADPKERSEHVMLVDLGRNDVGRVAKPATVRVTDVMSVEYYSHVMHISSTVTGELAEGKTAFDALRAALPVGTVSGAPKVRAMEIIDECEPTRRGPYAGAVGYVDFAGNMDTCIALRTLVLQPVAAGALPSRVAAGAPPAEVAAGLRTGRRATPVTPAPQALWNAYIQAGAGIVADSVPAREYEETLNKAQGLLAAIRMAEERFGMHHARRRERSAGGRSSG